MINNSRNNQPSVEFSSYASRDLYLLAIDLGIDCQPNQLPEWIIAAIRNHFAEAILARQLRI